MIQAIRGFRDVLPDEGRRWRFVEDALRRVLCSYAYEEVQLPLLESTELFSRGVGEATDIVEKEMYSLTDRDGDSITLRPEGTASCARALQQHGLLFNQTQRVFYTGPMFRYERPQKGRYRQFHQVGAEVFGLVGPDIDAELVMLGQAFWQQLGIEREIRLELNTLGSVEARAAYRDALVGYLDPYRSELDADSQRRLQQNPLRILDSKDPRTRQILSGAPELPEFVDAEGREHFAGLCSLLDELGVAYQVNPRLVRGLDYYTHTVFEWITDSLGSQGAVCAGGRYDGLVERIGGRGTPAAGFAVGLERVILLHQALNESAGAACELGPAADVYLCVMAPGHQGWAMTLAQKLRNGLPGFRIRTHAGGGKLKNQMKRADQSGARYALVIGEDEVQSDCPTLKYLREDRPQESLMVEELIRRLSAAESGQI